MTEPMARLGANVLGVDMSSVAIEVAQKHALGDPALSSLQYEQAPVEQLIERDMKYDAVLALEIVEHVAQPDEFIRNCAALVAEGGVLFVSTLNRTTLSYLFGILAAEHVLGWLPRGTHDWNKFLTPEEVNDVISKHTKLTPQEVMGIAYEPITSRFRTVRDTSVNYILCARRQITGVKEE